MIDDKLIIFAIAIAIFGIMDQANFRSDYLSQNDTVSILAY